MAEGKMVNYDRPKLERLKARYAKAVAAGEESFTFDGDEYLTGYAKYLIQYLETQLFGGGYGDG